jgi:hypothetical protein
LHQTDTALSLIAHLVLSCRVHIDPKLEEPLFPRGRAPKPEAAERGHEAGGAADRLFSTASRRGLDAGAKGKEGRRGTSEKPPRDAGKRASKAAPRPRADSADAAPAGAVRRADELTAKVRHCAGWAGS